MNEWRSCLILFLSNYPIGKEITAFNHRGEKQFRQDYFLFNKPPSRQEHLDCLLFHQSLFNIRLILAIHCLLCLSVLIFSAVQLQFQQSTSVLKWTHSPRKNRPRNWYMRTQTQSSGEHVFCVISSCLIVISLQSENQPISQHGGSLLVMCPAS